MSGLLQNRWQWVTLLAWPAAIAYKWAELSKLEIEAAIGLFILYVGWSYVSWVQVRALEERLARCKCGSDAWDFERNQPFR
jgi:hypothetical protein